MGDLGYWSQTNVPQFGRTFRSSNWDGGVLTIDEAAVVKALQPAADRMWLQIPEGDWAHRGADEMSPPAYQSFKHDK